jgi:hypothetical protein
MSLIYSEAKQQMINGLLQAASAHEAGRLQGVATSYDALDANLPREAGPEFDRLLIALNYWEGWIDARNHNWQYYEGMREADWPQLARSIVADLEADREITNGLVLTHFDYRNRKTKPGILRRLAGILLRKDSHDPNGV